MIHTVYTNICSFNYKVAQTMYFAALIWIKNCCTTQILSGHGNICLDHYILLDDLRSAEGTTRVLIGCGRKYHSLACLLFGVGGSESISKQLGFGLGRLLGSFSKLKHLLTMFLVINICYGFLERSGVILFHALFTFVSSHNLKRVTM